MSIVHDWKIRKIKKHPSKTVNYESGDVTYSDYICFIEAQIKTYNTETPENFVTKDVVLDWAVKPQRPPSDSSEYVELVDMTEEQYINIIKNSSIYSNIENIMEQKYIAAWGDGISEEIINPFSHEEFSGGAPDAEEMARIAMEDAEQIQETP